MPAASVRPVRRLTVELLEDRVTPASLIVTTLADSGAGSLREAIASANDETAHPGPDEIVFGPSTRGGTVNLTTFTNLSAGTAAVPQPAGPSAFLITSAINIRGTGETIARASAGGTANFRLFQVTSAGSLTLQSLTLTNGMAQGGAALSGGGGAGLGGAIYNQGTLNILGSTLVGNRAVGGGNADVGGAGGGGLGGSGNASNTGGAPNAGASGGGAGGFGGGGGSNGGVGGFGGGGGGNTGPTGGVGGFGGGGGAGNSNGGQGGFGGGYGGTASGNFLGGGGGGMGGAVFNQGGSATIANSTIAGNTAKGADTIGAGAWGGSAFGGGVFSLNGSLTLRNATIAGNAVSGGHGFQDGGASGGAVYVVGLNLGAITPTQNAIVTLDNSILANSTGGPDLVFGSGDGIPLIQTNGGRTILTAAIPPTPAVLPANIDVVANVKLGSLQNNGGFTPTILPQSGSPAIDTGLNSAATGLNTDQRGGNFVRISGGTIDVGAVETQPTPPPPPPAASSGAILVGGAANGTAVVLNQMAGAYSNVGPVSLFPGSPRALRTVSADVNGDGTPDDVGGGGPGGGPRVVVIDGATGSRIADFLAFESSFLGGVFVSAGDLDHDGRAELIVTPDQGGGPRVEIFSFASGSPVIRANFYGIDDPNFRGGARAALGDVNKDGTPDLLVAAGFGGGPRVALFNGASVLGARTKIVSDFFAFPDDAATLRNGIFAALGDISGDGFADLIFGGGPGGAPRVYILSGQLLMTGSPNLFKQPVANFFVAGNATDRGGVRLAAKNADGDAKADLVVGSGEGSPANVRVYLGKNFTGTGEPSTFQALNVFGGVALTGGGFVG
jgi:hypothetical protein